MVLFVTLVEEWPDSRYSKHELEDHLRRLRNNVSEVLKETRSSTSMNPISEQHLRLLDAFLALSYQRLRLRGLERLQGIGNLFKQVKTFMQIGHLPQDVSHQSHQPMGLLEEQNSFQGAANSSMGVTSSSNRQVGEESDFDIDTFLKADFDIFAQSSWLDSFIESSSAQPGSLGSSNAHVVNGNGMGSRITSTETPYYHQSTAMGFSMDSLFDAA